MDFAKLTPLSSPSNLDLKFICSYGCKAEASRQTGSDSLNLLDLGIECAGLRYRAHA